MNKNNCNEYIYNRYNGVITTYKKINDNVYICLETGFTVDLNLELMLGKTSENIIDLIEVGDYVNGHKIVREIWGEDDNNLHFEIEGGFGKATYIGEKNIKSIATKEMFLNAEYRVETN